METLMWSHESARLVFWLAGGLLLYAYLGYPLLVWVWAKVRPRPLRGQERRLPVVSIVVVARDEGERIEARVANLRALDYPADRVEIVIASDGSTDDTVALARACAPAGSIVLGFARARGKAAALADALRFARGDVVMLCDVRQRIEPGALRALVAPFSDPNVGAVTGTLAFESEAGAVGRGMGAYWRYECLLRACESAIDSTVGATGALYAIRRHLVEGPAPGTILDDMVLPCRVLRRGYRVVHEPRARAIDDAPVSHAQELERKARTQAGLCQLFARERWLLNPLKNRVWLQVVSHKGLRLASPFLLAGLFLASVALCPAPLFLALVAAQLSFYAIALAAAVDPARARARVAALPYAFCLLQVTVLLGWWRFLGHSQSPVWRRGVARPLATWPPGQKR